MSGLIVSNSNTRNYIERGYNMNDDPVQPVDYRYYCPTPQVIGPSNLDRDTDVLWPRSSFPGQATAGGNGFRGLESAHQAWEWNCPPTGHQGRKKVRGTVVDSNGNPVTGAIVQLFNTATGVLVDTQTSVADGSYMCGDPNAVNCFAVGYLPGSPDTEGTTVNTLTGT